MSKHSPGPWQILPEEMGKNYLRIRGTVLGTRYKIADVRNVDYSAFTEKDVNETKANALLIVSAPAILEEMKRYLTIIERAEANPELWAVLSHGTGIATANGYRAAIAKATGESE